MSRILRWWLCVVMCGMMGQEAAAQRWRARCAPRCCECARVDPCSETPRRLGPSDYCDCRYRGQEPRYVGEGANDWRSKPLSLIAKTQADAKPRATSVNVPSSAAQRPFPAARPTEAAPTTPPAPTSATSAPKETPAASADAPTAPPSKDLLTTLESDPRFRELMKAAKIGGVYDLLRNPGPFTIFAPTNEAFDALKPGELDRLKSAPDKLKEVLLYHALAEKLPRAKISAQGNAKSSLGPEVQFRTVGDRATVNEARLLDPEMPCTNGILHAVDKVLFPPGFKLPEKAVAPKAESLPPEPAAKKANEKPSEKAR
jgi:uncharacterized surface protein with fasciclin (FAS1) repeats